MLTSAAPATAASIVTGWSRDALAQPATSALAPGATGPFDSAPSASEPSENELPVPLAVPPVRLGAIAGVGFPHPLAVEALAEFSGYVAVGAEYGALPAVTIDNVRTSLWSLSADVRVFPFRGAFFIGLRAGRQHVEATTTVTIMSLGSATEVLDLDAWFLNPRIGFLWTSHKGITLGIDAGVQLPLGPSTTSTLPLALYPEAESTVHTLGSSALPTIESPPHRAAPLIARGARGERGESALEVGIAKTPRRQQSGKQRVKAKLELYERARFRTPSRRSRGQGRGVPPAASITNRARDRAPAPA